MSGFFSRLLKATTKKNNQSPRSRRRRRQCRLETLERRQLLASDLLFASNIPGADVSVNGVTYETPFTYQANPGELLDIETDAQMIGGEHFEFSAWGSGQPEDHQLVVPGSDAQFDVTFAPQMMMGMGGHHHHGVVLELTPHVEATHIAVQSGLWTDPSTWGGDVPGDGAQVLITEGRNVIYDALSDAQIQWIRVDGTLSFATVSDTRLHVDTIVTAPESLLEIGSEGAPIQSGVTAEILFSSDAAIDLAWDPRQLSRGLVAMGPVSVVGSEMLTHVPLATDVFAGDDHLQLALPAGSEVPEGWNVGDTLVVAGTSYDENGSDDDNTRFRDEVLTIASIVGDTITFTNDDIHEGDNTVLRFDHDRPEGYEAYDLEVHVANLTRNVQFSSADGLDTPIDHRGHIMLMHAGNEIRHAGFYGLGRTDKSELLDDPVVHEDGSITPATNARGRYVLHLHRNGVAADSVASNLIGNALWGGPGWGVAHHQSNANVEKNVVFDIVGAGIAAEAGDELGAWRNNLVIKTTGDAREEHDLNPLSPRFGAFDMGFNGEAYWVQGAAQIDIEDNIAASSGAGISLLAHVEFSEEVRDATFVSQDVLREDHQYIVTNPNGVIDTSDAPIRRLEGFRAFNVLQGIQTWWVGRNDDGQLGFNGPTSTDAHNERSVIEDFRLWNVHQTGAFLQYTTQLTLTDGLILGDTLETNEHDFALNGDGTGRGIDSNRPAQNHIYENVRVEGFEQGIRLPREGDQFVSQDFLGSQLIDVYLDNNVTNLVRYDGEPGASYPDFVQIYGGQFYAPEGNQLPSADFVFDEIGDQGVVHFDASNSSDVDPQYAVDALNQGWQPGDRYYDPLQLGGNHIVAYGWDFDSDGVIDEFGRHVNHHFDSYGSQQVSLTVWDSQGASSTSMQAIEIHPTAYVDPVVDGSFELGLVDSERWNINSTDDDDGWKAWNWELDPAGFAVANSAYSGGIAQVIRDDYARRGQHTLSMDLINTEGTDLWDNYIGIGVYGINGQFLTNTWENENFQLGVLPVEVTPILETATGGESFDWQTHQWDLDFGEGYEHIVIQIAGYVIDTELGDYLAIDNVALTAPQAEQELPVVQIETVQQEASEADGATVPALFEISRNGPLSGDLEVFYSVGGSATAGSDFAAPTGMVTIPAGSDSVSLEILPWDDAEVEGNEAVEIQIIADDGYELANQQYQSAGATIYDNDLPAIDDQEMSHSVDQLLIPLPEGPQYTAELLSDQAEQLDAAYNLYAPDWLIQGGYGESYQGYGVRWMQGDNTGANGGWYYVTPTGGLYQWAGSINDSVLLAQLTTRYFEDPSLIHNAPSVPVQVNIVDGTLIVDPAAGYVGEIAIRLSNDNPIVASSTLINVSVTNSLPELQLQDQVIGQNQGALQITLQASDPDGDALSYQATTVRHLANQMLAEHGLYAEPWLVANNYGESYQGYGVHWVQGNEIDGSHWYFLNSEGELYRWVDSIESSELLAVLDETYFDDPQLLLSNAEPTIQIEVVGDQLTLTPQPGFTGEAQIRVSASDGIGTASGSFVLTVQQFVEPSPAEILPVLMVINNYHFYYQEYGDTRASLEAAGIDVVVAAPTLDVAVPHAGSGGGNVVPDIAVAQADASNYSSIVIVGGWGAFALAYNTPYDFDNAQYDGSAPVKQAMNDLVVDFVMQEKYVTAICNGVAALSLMELPDGSSPLAGRTVASFSGSIPASGGVYTPTRVVVTSQGATQVPSGSVGDPTTDTDDVIVDGRIITAEDWDTALAFGAEIAELLIQEASSGQ